MELRIKLQERRKKKKKEEEKLIINTSLSSFALSGVVCKFCYY